jgi:hypothetical protein
VAAVMIAPFATSMTASAATKSAAVNVQRPMSQAAALAYWTPARMRAAKPVTPVLAGSPKTQSVGNSSHGTAGSVAGGLPVGLKEAPAKGQPQTPQTDAFSYPFPYDSYTVPNGDYHKYPWSVNGKVFFTNDGGGYVCSGTVVPSSTSTQNEVWTAGHCLVNTESLDGNYDTSLVFVPGYRGNATGNKLDPFGEYSWTGAVETTAAWQNNRDLSEDEAAFTVGTNASGQTLGNETGWAGFEWGQSTNQQFVAFGYPAASPYNGKFDITDLGASAVLDTSIGGSGSDPIGIGNPMTGGSSGGGWMNGWTETGPGYVDGHNDYKYSNQPLAMYSPYQDSLSETVRCFGASSC